MDLLPQLLPDTESPMLPTLSDLLELPLLLSQLLLEDMLELVGMSPTLLELSILPSVRLRLSLRLMLVFSTEPMAMVPVLDMLDLDMDIPVLDMLDMEVMDLDTVLDMLDMEVMDLDT